MTLTSLAVGGVEVKRGDVVAELDAESLIQQLADYEETISQTEANLRRQVAAQAVNWESLQQTVRSAKAQLDRAIQDYKPAEVRTDIERELLRLTLEEEQASYAQQLESVPLKEISLKADTRVQEISYARQLKRGEDLRNDLKNYTYSAPMDGMVVVQAMMRDRSSDMTQYKVGDTVASGQVFLKIVDTASMQLEARSNQAESSELRVGQPAKVMLDAFPGLTFQGRVHSLGAIAVQSGRESYWVRGVPVVIQIEGKDARLIPDLSGSAEVRVGQRDNALAVPIEALYRERDKYFVYVKGAAGFGKREVSLGVRNFLQAEIASGLKAGEQVALSKPTLTQ